MKFKPISYDAIAKLFETMKTYNSLTTQLILGAGATAYGKIKKNYCQNFSALNDIFIFTHRFT